MSQWDKLIAEILKCDSKLRFDDLKKALEKVGYSCKQPNSGSSHYIFRKKGCMPITIPKHAQIKRVYVELVAEAVKSYLEGEQRND